MPDCKLHFAGLIKIINKTPKFHCSEIIIIFPFLYIVTIKSELLSLGIKQKSSADLEREEKSTYSLYIFAPKNCQEKH